MGLFAQLGLLLWKNFTLIRKQPFRVAVEIIWPLTLFLILAWVKTRGLKDYIHECHFDSKPLPSAGLLPFMQGMLCTLNNTCHKTEQAGEMAGSLAGFDSSPLSQFLTGMEELLNNSTDRQLIFDFLDDQQNLMKVMNSSADCVQSSSSLFSPQELQNRLAQQNLSLSMFPSLVNTTINPTSLMSLLLQAQANPNDPNALVQNLRSSVCAQNQAERLFRFPTPEQSALARNQLCNLSNPQFASLVNATQFGDTLTACAANNSQNLQFFNNETLQLAMKFVSDLTRLSGTQALFSQINSTLNNTSGNLNNSLSMLLCGRESGALPPGFDALAANAMQRRSRNRTATPSTTQNTPINVVSDNNGTDIEAQFCKEVYDFMEKDKRFKALWFQIKPFVSGKILYTPDTPVTRAIVKEANTTFEELYRLKRIADDWLEISPNVSNYLATNPRVDSIRAALAVAKRLLPPDQANNRRNPVNTYSRWLYNGPPIPGQYDWRTSIRYTDEMMEMISLYLSCFEFDKFAPMKDEATLVKEGLNYISSNLLWAGIVFEVKDDNSTEVPTFIKYKIRMDSDKVDSTLKVTDRYWRPKPRRNPITDTKYYTFGFSFLQDMIEKGVVKLQTNQNSTPGIYLQQMPYPCYIYDLYWVPGPRRKPTNDLKYEYYGFAYIQDILEHGLIQLHTGINATESTGHTLKQFPYPCYVIDLFTMAISRTLPMFMVLAWIYSAAMIVKGIVYEKERRLKEVMKVMGLGNSVHWLAWSITCFSMMLVTVILLVIILTAGRVLEHSDPTVIFVFMLTFTIATISQCFMFSVFFSKANLAAACGGIFYFMGYMPYNLIVQWEEVMNAPQKAAASLLSSVAFGLGCSYFSRYEEQGIGIQWSNIDRSPIPDDKYSMAGCMVMMCIDTVLYGIVTWYVEAVFPGEYGVPHPWYFFVTKSYWCGRSVNKDAIRNHSSAYSFNHTYELNQNQTDSAHFEQEPTTYPVGVSIRNMRKVYKRGNKVAVDGLSLNFYEGQITSFLGHNGAGKTTTMSILTGLFPPTDGTAVIYDQDIRTDMNEIRNSMGMCPQHNVLFDILTVEEHLWFYARLKGMRNSDVKVELEQMIKDVGLPHKRNEKAKNLSGGMQRKLSVAIAFVAGSRVVILDEPTAGVDPYARRSIWELLLKYRKGRTIILSTHFMDEADILGDRIAIIAQGKLRCCGSSLFLKSRYANGYYLTMVKSDQLVDQASGFSYDVPIVNNEDYTTKVPLDDAQAHVHDNVVAPEKDPNSPAISSNSADSGTPLSEPKVEGDNLAANDVGRITPPPAYTPSVTGPSSDSSYLSSRITSFIRQYIPDAMLVENVGTEMTFQLPEAGALDGSFERLFTELDSNLEKLGVSSYGISDTTLEEVFLKVADDHSDNAEITNDAVEQLTEGGAYPRPVTRLSFRKKKLANGDSDTSQLVNGMAGQHEEEVTVVSPQAGNHAVVENGHASQIENCNGAGSTRVLGFPLIRRQFLALVLKRFHYVRRSKKGFISTVILPAFFICAAMLFAMIVPRTPEEPPLEIHPWHLISSVEDPHLYMFYSNDLPGNELTRSFEDQLSSSWVGTRCMNSSIYTISGYPCQDVKDKWTQRPLLPNGTISCDCSKTGYMQCPAGAGGPLPSMKRLRTSDNLYNMTGRNISDWAVKTMDKYIKKRYGGLSFGEINQAANVNSTTLASTLHRLSQALNGGVSVFNRSGLIDDLERFLEGVAVRNNAKIWFNNKGYVSSVAYMNVMNNMILRANLPPGKDPMNYGISLVNHPMNRTRKQLSQFTLQASVIDIFISISVIFAMSFIPASFVLFLIEERVSNSKHLQFVSGVNPIIYWVSSFCWDMINYLLCGLICFMLFLAFNQKAYVSADNAPCLILLLLLYGWAVTPLMYPACYVFNVPSSAFVGLACLNVFLGMVSTIATFILELFPEDQELININNILRQVFLILPHYCLGRGLMDMTRNQLMADTYAIFGENRFKDPFGWDLVGKNLFAMTIQGFVFFAFTLLIQYKFFCSSRRIEAPATNKDEEDVDVSKERQRVMSGQAANDMLVIRELTKVYKSMGRKKHVAVDSICVGVPRGECFGLLGVNGAGKTTTFKMLTGDIGVSKGDATLKNFSILTHMTDVHQNLGYCPQFDAICPLLTGREHLQLYARLRGVPEPDVNMVAEWAIHRLGLTSYANKCAGDYSGGNKRKLSTAVALVGNPPVVFLDEPTTGMDPKARRFLWNCISDIVKDGRSVILTSHSMEECEALCNRIAIMVNGHFKCLGSIQHLKSRFGDGYTLILRVAGHNPDMSPIKGFIGSKFPRALLRESHHNMLQYQLGCEHTSLAHLFGTMRSIKEQYNIEDYSISQTTLDQVFINFAKLQTDLLDDEISLEAARYVVPSEVFNVQEYSSCRSNVRPDSAGTRYSGLMQHGLQSNYLNDDEESLRGSRINLVPTKRPSSGKSLPGVTNC